jgi:GNAT superfamily N-acetyltransferase
MALIEIAHPDFRAELLAAAKERRYVYLDQAIPRAIFPWQESRQELLSNGEEVLVRPMRMTDEEALQRLFYELSEDSTYNRFLCHKRLHPHDEIQELVDLDYERNMGLVVCDPKSGDIVGMARYDLDPATKLADIAFVVRDECQGKGIGTVLLRRMAEIARARGLAGLQADVLASNKPMLIVFHRSGLRFDSRLEDNVYHLEAWFENKTAR